MLVAITVTLPAAAGAVKSPLAVMAPALADQVTAELKLAVPLTVAEHCDVVLTLMVAGTQVTATEAIVGGAASTKTVAVPDLVVSWVLVAVTVTLPAAGGAVKSPAAVMVPALADQVTTEPKLPVPWTVAAHCAVAPAFTVAGVQVTLTEVIVGAAICTVTDAVPDVVVSCVLVAVTVTIPGAAGAVKTPPAVMLPALVDQLTVEL
jgi:hypothetical protein